ncbi:hypothetical protein GGR55DRAFT_682390 [Xylaria sp. FL0064]|nr:hypothetical protein GGR55DRAFT_682390 [Xylaria sp. FL0064]
MEFTAESCEIFSMLTFHALQARLADRPSTDKCESEKSLFYFRARFLGLAAFYGLPVVDTAKKGVD